MKQAKARAARRTKRSAVAVAVLVLCSLSPAFATTHYEMNYRDMIRPNGQPRSDAVYNSALDYCYGQTGLARNEKDTAAFKSCMKGHGYRRALAIKGHMAIKGHGYQWLSTKLVQDPPSKQKPPGKQQASSNKQNERYIDPDTGLSCYNPGFASICESPQGTVHYTNKYGLDCTRTSFTMFVRVFSCPRPHDCCG